MSTVREPPRVVVLTAEGTPPPGNEDALRTLADVTVVTREDLADALAGTAGRRPAEVLLLWDFFSDALAGAWDAATGLRWVHVAAAGVDAVLFPALRSSEVLLTNAHGVFDRPIAEFVLAAVLAHDKQLHRSARLQREHRWVHRELRRTQGSTALVVGTGGIGRATARLLRAVGMEVRGAGRTARAEDPDFGTVVPTAELAEHAGWANHVVLAAPLTGRTHGIVGPRVLAAMSPHAHLVNVGRGALVDEDALLEALRAGRPAAATLDVFDTEPLPRDHPFWAMDNVHVSAHMCGDVEGWRDELAVQFEDNLRRWTAGERLVDQVDKNAGYVRSR
ncbi:D-2-hydroxyacid dehydrogenase [Kocuria sp. CPCC 205263]|uniref:D-2-hydroxyacid dehydrogenase n=1 Tax=Kocuria sp. CPCC 205263 TaxID=3073555 RepID=UPI0034D60CB6